MIKDAVAKRFEKICKSRKISYSELARLAGVTPSTVYSMLHTNRREVNVTTVKKLCDGLEIRMADFFDDPVFDEPEVQ